MSPSKITKPYDLIKQERAMLRGKKGSRPYHLDSRNKKLEFWKLKKSTKRKLRRKLKHPYAMCDKYKHIIFLIGKDRKGRIKRIYDLSFLHPKAQPNSNTLEEYNPAYILILNKRRDSYVAFIYMPSRPHDDTYMAGYKKRNFNRGSRLFSKMLKKYINRYFGYLKKDKPVMLVKTIQEFKVNEKVELRPTIDMLTKEDFISHYGKLFNNKKIDVADMWINSALIQEYKDVDFAETVSKGIFNLWSGFTVGNNPEITKEQADPLLYHIKHIWCKDDENLYNYVIRLLAHYIQHPFKKTGVILVLKSKQGAGKGIIVENHLGSLLGSHFASMTIQRATTRFNYLLARLLMVFLDEAVPKWNDSIADQLKTLSTAKKHTLEAKNKDPLTMTNNINLIMATNHEWACPIEGDDRRYCVLELSDEKCEETEENIAYFDELAAISPEAFYKALMAIDLKDYKIKPVPHTSAYKEQKRNSLSSVGKWWLNFLEDNDLVYFCKEPILKTDLYEIYDSWTQKYNNNQPLANYDLFWKEWNKLMPVYTTTRSLGKGTRSRAIILPDNETCRIAFTKAMKYDDLFQDK